ncbi:MAG: hypothetical protein WDO15_01380 [Bacteroidota bacterium]
MAVSYKINERRVIPNWRDFKRTVALNELSSPGIPKPLVFDLSDKVNRWNDEKTIASAADLINGAYIASSFGFEELGQAATFVINNAERSSLPLLDIAYTLKSLPGPKAENDEVYNPLEIDSFMSFQSYVDNKLIYKVLAKTRRLTYQELINPIYWVELSRLYAFMGNEQKAERAMIVAVNLAPNNRFVLRSATRMFVHFEQPEKALFYLRKSDILKHDPWLISAHIATSSIIERYSPLIKDGNKIITAKNHSNYELTELASTLATLEFSEGSIKKSKPLVSLAAISPNDNSLAQLEWLSGKESSFQFDPLKYTNVPNSFEAFAFEEYDRGNLVEAYNHSVNWFLDIPYSKRPVLFGSYLATMRLRDDEKAIALCKAGLHANPNDSSILNNLIYSLIVTNRINEAIPYIKLLPSTLKTEQLDNDSKITLLATAGLIAFRSGNIDEGKAFYNRSLASAEKIKNEHLKNLALLNYYRELMLSKCQDANDIKGKILSIDVKQFEDLALLKKEVLELEHQQPA